jgi:pyoverdine/dityrosine biosynthesis protein Dit1
MGQSSAPDMGEYVCLTRMGQSSAPDMGEYVCLARMGQSSAPDMGGEYVESGFIYSL